jgi:hypothetical protein
LEYYEYKHRKSQVGSSTVTTYELLGKIEVFDLGLNFLVFGGETLVLRSDLMGTDKLLSLLGSILQRG